MASVEREWLLTAFSRASRKLFLEGEDLLHVGRGPEGSAKLRAALRIDPQFAFACIKRAECRLSDVERRADQRITSIPSGR